MMGKCMCETRLLSSILTLNVCIHWQVKVVANAAAERVTLNSENGTFDKELHLKGMNLVRGSEETEMEV